MQVEISSHPQNQSLGRASSSLWNRACVHFRPIRRVAFLLLLAFIVLVPTGCIRRRLTVRSNPPGAMVYVDKQSIGLTPASSNFTYYGTRNIEIVRDGYRTEKFLRRFSPPWYAIPPLDFFSETLWPFEKRDERIIDVQLTPEPVVPDNALIASGEQLRLQASQGVAVKPPPTVGPVSPFLIPPTAPAGSIPGMAPPPIGTFNPTVPLIAPQ
jgi:hypothetical protein